MSGRLVLVFAATGLFAIGLLGQLSNDPDDYAPLTVVVGSIVLGAMVGLPLIRSLMRAVLSRSAVNNQKGRES